MQKLVLVAVLLAARLSAQPLEVGSVSFANSGAPEAQAAFHQGLAQLHNFEYASAAEFFRKAQEIDPSFAMAYWGEAMTHTHPIWFQQDLEAARAVLQRLGKTPEQRLAKAKSERERDYLRTLDVLYGEGSKNDRDFRFVDAMAALHAKYPDDVDATAFNALAILGTAHEGRDFAIYMRSAALLEEVLPANRRHPGVLHYLIHSYDDPVHAPLGMRAARLYGGVAPHAGHALHMTSHIFIALGLWDDVIDANIRAIATVNAQRKAKSKPAADCGHYPTWLHYGYLQQHRYDDARRMLDACRAYAFPSEFIAGSEMDTPRMRLSDYADMLTQHTASGQALTPADTLALPKGMKAPNVHYTLTYAGILDAARRGDAKALESAVNSLRDQQKILFATDADRAGRNAGRRERAQVMLQEAEALLLIAKGRREEALPILEAAAKTERALPFEFGPPDIPKPASELLAEQLLAAGRGADAAAAYENALKRAPGRTIALTGLQVAQKSAKLPGREEKAPPAAHVH
jgi:tetratricopeptide (TPR) repeat protein